MLRIRNAAPRPILHGIRDLSGRPPVYDPEQLPTHLPHVYLLAERGPTVPTLTSGSEMMRLYGEKTFDFRSKFANHQTVLASVIAGEANQLMVQRVVPHNANPPATIRLSVDMVKDQIPLYQRTVDGTFLLDEDGNKIPTGDTVEGYKLRWVVEPTNEDFGGSGIDPEDEDRLLEDDEPRLMENGVARILQSAVGDANVRLGEMTNGAGEQSQIYPIMDMEVQWFGSYGNRVGIRLSAPTTKDIYPIDDETVVDQLAYLYRLQFVERPDSNLSPKISETLYGEQFIDFSFKQGVISERLNREYYLEDTVRDFYSQEPVSGLPEINGPVGRVHVYHNYLEHVLEELQSVEAPHGLVGEDSNQKHLINPFTAHDHNGTPYHAIKLMGPTENGTLFTSNTTHYFMGGSDGHTDLLSYDALVRYETSNYGDLEAKVLDSALYPQSVIYDSGFSMETKKALISTIGRRKDLWVITSTQDVNYRKNTPSEESSIAIALRTYARMFPESVIYGTPVCRVMVFEDSGHLLDHPYRGLLPVTVEFAQKCARWMGAGNGVWRAGLAIDAPPNNHVKLFRGTNATLRPASARSRDWDNGLVWIQNYDRRSQFWPAFQTVYDDDTSVLNAAPNMFVAVELQKVAERVWRDLTGISSLTPDQFIERSNRLIEERTRGRFDGRVIIVPETFFTQQDEQRGYSWSCNIHMYAPNMRTVGTFTVVSHRITDYEG